jgi:anti-anti-sigma factor
MSDLARLEVKQRGGYLVVAIHGEIDISNAHELTEAIERSLPNGDFTLVIDLTHTTYLDSSGVQLLFTLSSRMKTRRRRMRVMVPERSHVRTVLEIAAVSQVIPVVSSLEEA